MTKTKGYIILAFIVITNLFILCIFEIKDQYDKELNEAIKNKDEKAIDKALETFAINEKTGVIDINKAISIVTNNAINEAIDCIINNKDFDTDMSKYDIAGRKVVKDE